MYERGVNLFKWPQVEVIWTTYLTRFVERYVCDLLSPLGFLPSNNDALVEERPVSHFHFVCCVAQEGSKVERARDLFEQALQSVPEEHARRCVVFVCLRAL